MPSDTYIAYQDDFGLIYIIEFDAVMAETHTDTAAVTEHTIESGGVMTDYARPSPTKVSLEALITNTPIVPSPATRTGLQISRGGAIAGSVPYVLRGAVNRWATAAQVRGGHVSPITYLGVPRSQVPIVTTPATKVSIPNIVGGASLQFPRGFDAVSTAYQVLRKLLTESKSLTLFSPINDFNDMYISSLSAPRMAENGMILSIELTSVKFASSSFVGVTKKIPEEKRAEIPEAPVEVPTGRPYSIDDDSSKSTVFRETLQSVSDLLQGI